MLEDKCFLVLKFFMLLYMYRFYDPICSKRGAQSAVEKRERKGCTTGTRRQRDCKLQSKNCGNNHKKIVSISFQSGSRGEGKRRRRGSRKGD
jgi:hypothetical protein